MRQNQSKLQSFLHKPFVMPLAALLCALLWGSAFPAIKTVYKITGMSSVSEMLSFAGIRFFFAGLLVLLFIKNKYQHCKNVSWKLLLGVTATQVIIQYVCFYVGLAKISGVLAAILVSTGSFWWVFLAPLVDKSESIHFKQILYLTLGFAGVALCVYNPDKLNGNHLSGVALYLIAPLAGAIGTVMVKPLSKQVPVPMINGVALAIGGLFLMAISTPSLPTVIGHLNGTVLYLTIHLALVSSLAFSLWYLLVVTFDVTRLSGYRFLIPICGALESVLFLQHEKLSQLILPGSCLVLLSVILLERFKAKSKKEAKPKINAKCLKGCES